VAAGHASRRDLRRRGGRSHHPHSGTLLDDEQSDPGPQEGRAHCNPRLAAGVRDTVRSKVCVCARVRFILHLFELKTSTVTSRTHVLCPESVCLAIDDQ
jgi:hypothetical protein